MRTLRRNISAPLLKALSDSPVVLLHGARQTGKTTLVKALARKQHRARYLTLDDAGVLSAAKSDPAGFIGGLEGPVILDEVQRAPELFVAIKAAVDRDRRPGRFLLTGSAHIMLLPQLSDSLAGRMEVLTLWPLSQGEIEGVVEGFIDAAFGVLPVLAEQKADPIARALRGGYPEVLSRTDEEGRRNWFGACVTTILQRDVRDLAHIEGLTEMPRLLSLFAARAAGIQNFSELAQSSRIAPSTLKRYLALLETTFLIQELRPWSGNLGQRLVKSPKVFLADTGLMAYLLGLSRDRLNVEGTLKGPLLESFVVMELRKQIAWSRSRPRMFFFRTQTGHEVDVVLEDAAGNLVGIEVKASATVGAGDLRGLRVLAELTGRKFRKGIVLYTGPEAIPFGPHLYAVPMGALWQAATPRGAEPKRRGRQAAK
jgi:predicted AAA+ superfamily ATPase